jgi:hypothetical protein
MFFKNEGFLPETGESDAGGESGETAAKNDQWVDHRLRCLSILAQDS